MLYVNGKVYKEFYLDQYKKEVIDGNLIEDFKLEDVMGKKIVSEGYLFVMGDN